MKCINKKFGAVLCGVIMMTLVLDPQMVLAEEEQKPEYMMEYEQLYYNRDLFTDNFFLASDYCVSLENVIPETYPGDQTVHGAALFDVTKKQVDYAYSIHEKIYPASVTKIMTALLALEYGNLADEVTINANAAASAFPYDAQVCGLRQGDVWTLQDLLNALMLYSGNDAATAIAEYVSGSEEAFVALMNQRCKELYATNTHFTNPHGLHDENHYTTVYDLYLIFNECIKNDAFVNIISQSSYTANYRDGSGTENSVTFYPTNLYAKGSATLPVNASVVGGKTGTTGEAGYCLILLIKNQDGNPYISVVMGAENKPTLYADMTSMIEGTLVN